MYEEIPCIIDNDWVLYESQRINAISPGIYSDPLWVTKHPRPDLLLLEKHWILFIKCWPLLLTFLISIVATSGRNALYIQRRSPHPSRNHGQYPLIQNSQWPGLLPQPGKLLPLRLPQQERDFAASKPLHLRLGRISSFWRRRSRLPWPLPGCIWNQIHDHRALASFWDEVSQGATGLAGVTWRLFLVTKLMFFSRGEEAQRSKNWSVGKKENRLRYLWVCAGRTGHRSRIADWILKLTEFFSLQHDGQGRKIL